jgi:lysophospholipase L1-like esterase
VTFAPHCSIGSDAREAQHVVLYVLGDSIMYGSLATSPELGCIELVRARVRGTIVNNSAPGRPLYLMANTPVRRAARVAEVVAANASAMWIALGINDYVLSGADGRTNLAEYTATMPLLLDALHAALPNLRIFVQSPIVFGQADPNNAGETVAQYRSAGQAACVGRPFAEYVDGLAIMTLADLHGDDVHPVNSGHALIADELEERVYGT